MDSNLSPSRLRGRRTKLRFTVRRPASAEVSPCCHRPSGGDVACSIHVRMARPRPAGDTLENRLALAVFRRDMPAAGASLRRIRCRDELKPPQDLMLQPGHLAPRRATVGAAKEVTHRLGEVPQRLLLHSLRPGRQPVVLRGALLVVPRRAAARLPVQLLLDGKIPHKPGMATVFGQHCSLLRAGK